MPPSAARSLPLDAVVGRGANFDAREDGSVETTLAAERVVLLAERALLWPREDTLFVADLHLGKAAAFRAGGVPVPRGATAADLARLSALLARTGARRLVVLGDFLHAAAGRVPALDAAFARFRDAHAALAITVVRGNHDESAGDPPDSWRVDVVAEPHPAPPFLLCHEPARPRSGFALCGHVHPGVLLTGPAHDSARVPCFVLGRRLAVLPAFGRLTGLALVAPAAGEIRVAIAGSRLFVLR
jgi:DNA ligase-associated metallophosphoesterase